MKYSEHMFMEIGFPGKAGIKRIISIFLFTVCGIVTFSGVGVAFMSPNDDFTAFTVKSGLLKNTVLPPEPFPVWKNFREKYGKDFHILWDKERSAPVLLYGGDVDIYRNMGESVFLHAETSGNRTADGLSWGIESALIDFISREGALFQIDTDQLELVRYVQAGRWGLVRFRQLVDGLPAFGISVSALILNNRLTWLYSGFVPGGMLDRLPGISGELAALKARDAVRLAIGGTVEVTESGSPVLGAFRENDDDNVFIPAFLVKVIASSNKHLFKVMVDASTGIILSLEDATGFAYVGGYVKGLILPNDPLEEQVIEPFQLLEMTCEGFGSAITDENGLFGIPVYGSGPFTVESTMEGPWFTVTDSSGTLPFLESDAFAGDTLHLMWNDENSEIEERNVFYHLGIVYSYIKNIDPDFTGIDRQLPVVVNEPGGSCNALYNGEYMLFFPESGICFSFAKMRDVVYHEFGHYVNDMIFSEWQWPLSSWDEGTADYLAATITGDPVLAEKYQGEGTFIRNCDNDRVYPAPECGGESHCVGEATAGTLWHMRQNLIATLGETAGIKYADSLFQFAKYVEPPDETVYFSLIVSMDDNDTTLSNGTPHGFEIGSAISRHGFGQRFSIKSVTARDITVNPDYPLSPGDTASVTFTLDLDPGSLSASTLTGHIELSDPDIEILHGTSSFSSAEPGCSTDNDADPFLIIIPQDWEGVSDVRIYLELDAYPNLLSQNLETSISIGSSNVLLVDTDPAGKYKEYYLDALSSLDVIPNVFTKYSDEQVPYNKLLPFDLVIWFTGDAGDSSVIDSSDKADISEFLDEGGKLFLTGQGIADDSECADFLKDKLDLALEKSSMANYILYGINGSSFESTELWIIGQGGANNQLSPDAMSAVGLRATALLDYSGGEGMHGAFLVEDEDTGSKSVVFSFGFEGITGAGGTTDRNNLMKEIFEVLDFEQSVEKKGGTHTSNGFNLTGFKAVPNPCNPSTMIRFVLEGYEDKLVSLSIYDISGKLIKKLFDDRLLSPGQYSVEWNGRNERSKRVVSGVYLVVVEVEGKRFQNKIVVLK